MTFVEQIKAMWARWTPRQRLIVGGGTAATLLALLLLTRAMATPEMKPLIVGLEPADAQAIATQLGAKKIAYQMTPDGKGINVAADQLDQARLEVASEGAPHSGRMGFELFDKVSWGQTEFDEKVNYQRALEGELERTIGTMSDVKSARVHLVLPRNSVFLERERAAKASVTLRLKRGGAGGIGQEQLDAIARLVSGAVDNLQPADVAIIDADSNQALGRKGGSSAAEREMEEELSKRLVATLGPAVGAENLRASVNVEYDMSTTEESQDNYDPKVSALLQTQKSSEQNGGGDTAGGVAGTTGNLPASAAGANGTAGSTDVTGADGSSSSNSENSTFGVNKVVRHVSSPAGRIKRITAAVLVNDETQWKQTKGKWEPVPRKRTPAQMKQLEDLAQAVLGMDSQRGDVLHVENMAFDDSHMPEEAPTMLARVREGAGQYGSALRYVGLLAMFGLVYALMFRPAQRQMAASMKELAAGKAAATAGALEGAANMESLEAATEGVTLGGSLEGGASTLKRQLAEMVQAEPVAMTRTVQAWLREEKA